MEINRQTVINVSADKLWKIVGTEFNDISKWAAYVETSYANPDLTPGKEGRVCQVTGYGEVMETLTEFDDQQRKLAFVFESKKNPFFVKNIDYTWQVKPKGDNQSELYVDVEVKLMPVFKQLLSGTMSKMLTERTDMVIDQLKYFAENRKAKAID